MYLMNLLVFCGLVVYDAVLARIPLLVILSQYCVELDKAASCPIVYFRFIWMI